MTTIVFENVTLSFFPWQHRAASGEVWRKKLKRIAHLMRIYHGTQTPILWRFNLFLSLYFVSCHETSITLFFCINFYSWATKFAPLWKSSRKKLAKQTITEHSLGTHSVLRLQVSHRQARATILVFVDYIFYANNNISLTRIWLATTLKIRMRLC